METNYLGSQKTKEIIENQILNNNESMFCRYCLTGLMKSEHGLSDSFKKIIINNLNEMFIDGKISREFLDEMKNEN